MYSSHEKTKTTFTLLRTVCKGGLHNYCCFNRCWCFYVFFCTVIFFLFICVFFCSDINECIRGLHKIGRGGFLEDCRTFSAD